MTITQRTRLRIDEDHRTVRFRGSVSRVTRKAIDLVSLLGTAQVLAQREGMSIWVTAEQIATLPSWTGSRSLSSLKSQIRREIKDLHKRGIEIAVPRPRQQLSGPFSLAVPIEQRTVKVARLRQHLEIVRSVALNPEDMVRWLDTARPIWKSLYWFDKPDQHLADTLDDPKLGEPLLDTMISINVARRAREVGKSRLAFEAISQASGAARSVQDPFFRSALEATCRLQLGWTQYREEDFTAAARTVHQGLKTLDRTGHGHLRVRGQLLTLRSLLRRRSGHLNDALHDLRLAAEAWLIELDLYNLFSVYHNLSVLIESLAGRERDPQRRMQLLKLALYCAQKNKEFCLVYKLGHNSVLNQIHLARLYDITGDRPRAIKTADKAFAEAVEIGNHLDAAMAHSQRIKLRLLDGRHKEAARLHGDFLKSCDPSIKNRVIVAYAKARAARRIETKRP